jgi:hypothetical protein
LAEFIGLYRGRTASEAELVAITAEPRIVRRFISELLGEGQDREDETAEHLALIKARDERGE